MAGVNSGAGGLGGGSAAGALGVRAESLQS